MIKEDAQEEHVIDEKNLKEKKCLKDLYDNVFRSQKNIVDDNFKHHFITELTITKLHEGNDISRLLIFLFKFRK